MTIKPNSFLNDLDYARMEKAIRYLEGHWWSQPSLTEMAEKAGLSSFHFQRLFHRWVGISPKSFVQYLTLDHAKRRLEESQSVLTASYDSGLSGPGRLHDLFISVEAMTPGEYKAGGRGMEIEVGFHGTPFGKALTALTPRGICGFSFVPGSEKEALTQLQERWPKARFVKSPERSAGIIRGIFRPKLSRKTTKQKIVLRGTPFQLKVWEALLRIPPGALWAYGDVARSIGNPKAFRAVGTAIGQNPIAYLIPCHRVIQETGVLGNYRWGSYRKRMILAWEAAKFNFGDLVTTKNHLNHQGTKGTKNNEKNPS